MFDLKDFILQFLVRGLVLTTAVHEYGHLLALCLLGFSGEIRSGAMNMVFPIFGRPITAWEYVVVYGSGGFFQAVVFLLLSHLDEENKIISRMIAVMGVVYGYFEALFPRTFWEVGAFLGMVAATFVFLAYYKRNVLFQKSN